MQLDAEANARLLDIVDGCEAVAAHIGIIEYEVFANDRKTRSAVERELITIGEAMRVVLQTASVIEHYVTDAQGIVDFRNVLVHGYRKLDPRTIWAIVKTEVPVLQAEVRTLLAAGENPA